MVHPLLHQAPSGLTRGVRAGAQRCFTICPARVHAVHRTAALSTQASDAEREPCSTGRGSEPASPEGYYTRTATICPAEEPSCSGAVDMSSRAASLASALVLASGVSLLLAGSAWASGGTFTGGAFELFKEFLDQVESMGPAGCVVFVLVVMLSEMIPLFPTQPLSLASGLLFGGKQGAVLMLLGVTLAAVNAFVISRGVGRPLAEKVISMEMGEEPADAPGASSHNAVARKLGEVQRTIETGSFGQQLLAVALLRLTPVVPFSASNYVLGLTPLQLPAFLGGTVAGMAVWSVLYASVGGAGRGLLESGSDMGTVFAELAERSTLYTRPILLAAGGLAAAALLVYLVSSQLGKDRGDSGSDSDGGGGGSASSADGGADAGSERGGKGEGPGLRLREQQLTRK